MSANAVASLYRRSLKLALDWAVHRQVWRGQAVYIRSLFEANKDVRDPRQQRVNSPAPATIWPLNAKSSAYTKKFGRCSFAKPRNYWKPGNTRIRIAHLLPQVAVNMRETFLLGSYLMRLNMQIPTKFARRTRPLYLPQLDEFAQNNGFHSRR
ncbi:hypothetical protein CNMCM5793_007821 [Aspergillus hiratsukae]|uniref:NADH dehydrogenase [ubiquinone] 1 beta subcomplex subunit 9 n=1 Tax=Aspergillus hiratsukae TaxID=1194566 RepID=A0A8H6P6K0_9EURO|nr:hypothetical protein CNMCM5793_007821 [Aspergillus hiratsukae]